MQRLRSAAALLRVARAAPSSTRSATEPVSFRAFSAQVVYPPAAAVLGQQAPDFTLPSVLNGDISTLTLSKVDGWKVSDATQDWTSLS